MPVTFAEDCFDPDSPADPDGDHVDEYDDAAEMSGHYQDGWEAEPRFRVVTDDIERAAAALLVAAERFMWIGPSGTEYGTTAPAPATERTPSSSGVGVDSESAYIWADTSEWLSHPMAATMKQVLVEELTRAGVSALISADYNPIRGIHAQRWPLTQG